MRMHAYVVGMWLLGLAVGCGRTHGDRQLSGVSDPLGVVTPHERTDHGFRSFFVRGPDRVLIEFVEAGPITAP